MSIITIIVATIAIANLNNLLLNKDEVNNNYGYVLIIDEFRAYEYVAKSFGNYSIIEAIKVTICEGIPRVIGRLNGNYYLEVFDEIYMK